MKATGELLDTYGYDWRTIFQAYSLVGIVWSAAFYAYFRTRPNDHPWVNAADVDLIRESPLAETPDAVDVQPRYEDSRRARAGQMLASRSLWGICIQSYFRAAGYLLFVTWLPAFLEYAYGLSVADAASYTTWPLIGVIVGKGRGGLVVGAVYKMTGSRRLSRTGVAVASLSMCALFTFASTRAGSPELFAGFLACGACFSGLANPPAWAATMDIAGPQTAVVMGIMNMVGTIAGFTVPNRLGALIDRIQHTDGDWNTVILIHVVFYACAALSWLLVDPNRTIGELKS